MTPRCANCGGHVTRDYVRVRSPNGRRQPRCCPACEDKIRDGADVRDARSPRRSGPIDEADQADDDSATTRLDYSRLSEGGEGA
jgi:NAD-dependent SIR2 family protein deacetylase